MRISDWSSDVCSSDLLAPKRYRLIGGHVPAIRYLPMIPVARSFTFIRNPVDQLMSHYEHHVRNFGFQGTLEAFIKTAAAGPIATKMLRSEEHTSELQSLMRTSYAVFCLKKKIIK